MKTRVQYGLPALFGGVTFLCFAFAFPSYVLGATALLIGAIVALAAFISCIYIPVTLIANWLQARAVIPEPNSSQPEGRKSD